MYVYQGGYLGAGRGQVPGLVQGERLSGLQVIPWQESHILAIIISLHLKVIGGKGNKWKYLSSMILILDGTSEHIAHAWRKKVLKEKNPDCPRSNQMPERDQMTEMIPYMRI